MKTENQTIVYFHTGRGGRFNNGGFRTFNGTKNILEVLQIADNSGQNTFIHNKDVKGRFVAPYYADCNGNEIITVKEANSGIGRLNWDGQYDTDVCSYLRDCDETELMLIAQSKEWNKESILQEFFNECTDLKLDWKKFNGNYEGLITEYFNFPNTNVEQFYQVEEVA